MEQRIFPVERLEVITPEGRAIPLGRARLFYRDAKQALAKLARLKDWQASEQSRQRAATGAGKGRTPPARAVQRTDPRYGTTYQFRYTTDGQRAAYAIRRPGYYMHTRHDPSAPPNRKVRRKLAAIARSKQTEPIMRSIIRTKLAEARRVLRGA